MQVVILAGGRGTRIAEESSLRPKPMIEIGQMPLLWHIMKRYSLYGHNDFVIALGYKGYAIKEYFLNYHAHNSNLEVSTGSGEITFLKGEKENWKVKLIDTGMDSSTGTRLKILSKYLVDDTFFMTYGDGLSDIDFNLELKSHKDSGKMATIAAVQHPGRFGILDIDSSSTVKHFREKPSAEFGKINGGFFVLEPEALNHIVDERSWETGALVSLAESNQLNAFSHSGFWKACDTMKDKSDLEEIWETENIPWLQA